MSSPQSLLLEAPSPCAACLLGLRFIVGKQPVQLLDERSNLIRELVLLDPVGAPGPHVGNRLTKRAQRPEPVECLQRRHDDQAEPEQRKAAEQCLPERPDLIIKHFAALRDLALAAHLLDSIRGRFFA